MAEPYPLPLKTLVRLVGFALARRTVPFGREARAAVAHLHPPLVTCDLDRIPAHGPCLVTINHYTRPGLPAWWMVLAVSAALPHNLHWIVSAAWTYPDRLRRRVLTPFSRWAFQRMADVYGFQTMPPMPPRPQDVEWRARAVRQVLAYARSHPAGWIGLAPEGRDIPGSVLGEPPAGVGRMILQVARQGYLLQPVGIFERDGSLCLQFGHPYSLEMLAGTDPGERDAAAARTVMDHIAALLPTQLRGGYSHPHPPEIG